MAQITPSVARIQYDVATDTWKLHPSRYLKTVGVRFDRDTVREFRSLLELIQELMLFWALLASPAGDTRVGSAEHEDLATFQAFIGGALLAQVEVPDVPEGTPTTGAIDYEAMTEYDGTGDDWGATAP